MTPELLTSIFAFLVGAVVGSFLNVVIHRVPRGMSIVWPPSACASCGERISWYNNIPIVSYMVLGGRCASCGARFSLRYPVVELVTAVTAVACVQLLGPTPLAVRTFAFVSLLIALTYIDLEHWLLPHAITWPGIGLGLVTSWLPGAPGLAGAAIGAVAGFVGFWLLRVIASAVFRREALGGGDLWLLAMIGAFLGWEALLPVVFLGSAQGSVVGVFLLLFRRGGGDFEREKALDEDGEAFGQALVEEGRGAAPEMEGHGADEAGVEDGDLGAETVDDVGEDGVAGELVGVEGKGETDEEDLDELEDERDEEWTPPENAVPFGPFLALGALQLILLEDLIMSFIDRVMGAY